MCRFYIWHRKKIDDLNIFYACAIFLHLKYRKYFGKMWDSTRSIIFKFDYNKSENLVDVLNTFHFMKFRLECKHVRGRLGTSHWVLGQTLPFSQHLSEIKIENLNYFRLLRFCDHMAFKSFGKSSKKLSKNVSSHHFGTVIKFEFIIFRIYSSHQKLV